jgi:arsenate reductase
METDSLLRLSTLAHAGRMAVFRLLMRRYPDAVPAGEIADALALKASTLSAYLAALCQCGLVAQTRHGTSLRYRVRLDEVRALGGYIFNECCRGRPDLCPPDFDTPAQPPAPGILAQGAHTMPHRPFSVLFLCTGNSARSLFAEALLRQIGGDRFVAHSAGTNPSSQPNPFAIEMLQAKGHDVTPLRTKHVSEFQRPGAPAFDFVFTVCDRSANEECPVWEGLPVTSHWSLPDPVQVTGTDAEKRLAFQQSYGALRNRIIAFTALPLDTLDKVSMQHAVDRLHETRETT